VNKNLKVFKFGGASVKDAASIKNVLDITNTFKEEQLVIVVSAMAKTTNNLEKIVDLYTSGADAFEELEKIKQFHYRIAAELFENPLELQTSLNDTFVEIEWLLEEPMEDSYDYVYDQIVSVGELLSTQIVAAYFKANNLDTEWVDARDLILTDNIYREGWVQWDETTNRTKKRLEPILNSGKKVITQGFIGSTSENFTTTLGREGSDYSAAIFAYCLDAGELVIWKDVPGVLTGDPRYFDQVTKLEHISYREAIEMTYYGAKVIHQKTIKPLQNKNIQLHVRSFINPEGSGTLITADVEENYPPIVSVERDQALIRISTKDFSFVAAHHMSFLFTQIAALRIQVNLMQNTAISFVVCVNDSNDKVDRFTALISEEFNVSVERELDLYSVRHYNESIISSLKSDKLILAEERMPKTMQFVTKSLKTMQLKAGY
jgi:aspartate kinase